MCLNILNIYIDDFMNKINKDFEREKNDIKWTVIILNYSLIFFCVYLFVLFGVICDTRCQFRLKFDYYRNSNINNKDIIDNNTDSDRRVNVTNTDDTVKELNKKNEEIRELKEKYNTLKNNNRIEIHKLKKDIEKLNQKIIKEKKEKEDLSKELNILKEKTKNISASINEKEKEINFVRSSLPFQIKEGEKLMCVVFLTTDQQIHYPMICKNTQIFNTLENLLYEKFDKYKETKHYFLCNGIKINESKTLEENNIKDGSVILLIVTDNE